MKNPAIPLLFLLLCSCSPSATSSVSKSDEVKVVVEKGQHFTPEQEVYRLSRGEEASIRLRFEPHYSCGGIDYEGATYAAFEGGLVEVHLPPVRYSCRLSISEISTRGEISLHLNGGSFLLGKGEGDSYLYYVDDSHLRPVLPAGVDTFSRPGYALLGWNTEIDGSGEEVGLGSRYNGSVDDVPASFYAHYEKENPARDFLFTIEDNEVSLRSYVGEAECQNLIVPSSIGNYRVTSIERDCFNSLEVERLSLPLSLRSVAPYSFHFCRISSLYFYDNLEEISDDCFVSSSIGEARILAHEPVRGIRSTFNSVFAEDIDRLALGKGRKKIVYFSGCSGSFSVDSKAIENALDGRYYPVNLGVLGDTNATAMWDCILRHLEEGDILIHAPEEMSVYSLLNDISCDRAFFTLYEGNFDLLKGISPTDIPNFFTGYAAYRQTQKEEEKGNYTDRCPYYNEYGDCATHRPNSAPNADYEVELAYGTEFLDAETCNRLNAYYDKVRQKGAIPVFSYAPINKNAVDRLDPRRTGQQSFDASVRRNLNLDVISDIASSEFAGEYCYDTDYHLSEEGRQVRTERLIRDLKAFLG